MNFMVDALEMQDDGTSSTVSIHKGDLDSHSVYCIVDESNKNVWLWIGKEAPVRKRFVGAQTASKLREEQGTGFRVRSIDEGYEDQNFLSTLEEP
jgi:hypothetical protein